MKILHVLQSGRFSGAENVVCQIINMLKNDENIEMAYCSHDGQIREVLKEKEIKFIPFEKLTKKEIKRIINEYKPDLIHAHDMRATYVVSKACGKIPFVSHVHVNTSNSRKLNLRSIAFYSAAKKAKHIYWVSDTAFNQFYFNKSLANKSSILYNIIDIDDLYRKMEEDKQSYNYDVLFIGRLVEQKDPHRLLKISNMLKIRKPDIKIAVVGTGELLEELKQEASMLGLDNNVTFLGYQTNPTKILHDAKIMLMTSRFEGTPMSALEAMALGTPIVSTPVDGLKELITNDENGSLSNDDGIIANKILEYLSNENIYNILSKNQIKKAKIWNDKENYKNKLLEVYTK